MNFGTKTVSSVTCIFWTLSRMTSLSRMQSLVFYERSLNGLPQHTISTSSMEKNFHFKGFELWVISKVLLGSFLFNKMLTEIILKGSNCMLCLVHKQQSMIDCIDHFCGNGRWTCSISLLYTKNFLAFLLGRQQNTRSSNHNLLHVWCNSYTAFIRWYHC